MRSVETFSLWRQEIAIEKEAAQEELGAAFAALATATEAARAAMLERRALGEALDHLGRRQPIAPGIAMRRIHRDRELRALDGAVSLAKQRLRATVQTIEDCAAAIAQLDELAPPEPAEAEWVAA